MHEFTGSALRILAGVVIGLALLLALAFWGVRLPGFRSQPWPGGPRAQPARLEGHVRALARTDPPRSVAHPEGLARAADYVTAALAGTRATVAEQHYRAEGQGYRNLVARFGPATGPVVVVGAHYDVFGALPGADDNASGVAGLLELARMLDAHEPELATAVELVAYSTEEPPFFGGRQMGSSVHARGLQAGGAEVRAMIALEMIGYFTAEQPHISPLLDLLYPRSGDFVLVVGRWSDRGLVRRVKRAFRGAGTLRAVSYTGPRIVGTDWSDHSSYWEEGYPAVMITDTAFFRNPHYHLQGDTPDTLDYRRMAGVVDGVLAAVVRLAGR